MPSPLTKPHTIFPNPDSCTIAVIGLGYVGLPLALEFAKEQPSSRGEGILNRKVFGFDVNHQRLGELKTGYDRTNETTPEELASATSLYLTSDADCLKEADVFIVTVPTPIDNTKRPDLVPLEKASFTVGRALRARAEQGRKAQAIVIYESTVYPGATEEVCVPILEAESQLVFNEDFFCGYSPERINPGDRDHRLTSIVKVTSGSTTESALWIDNLYASIIDAGTHKAPTIKVAEAAKVIENTQRDLNIALVNELAIIFREMNVDTLDVLEAAGTKWNFLPFRPGLVGGHCIGVDPYYLTHKAEQLGYNPQVVLAGRRINDGICRWVVEQVVLELAKRGSRISGSRVLVLGLSFKENCPDLRNTRVVDLLSDLRRYGMNPYIVDPWVDPKEAETIYNEMVVPEIPENSLFDVVILAVAHTQFATSPLEWWHQLKSPSGLFVDLKGCIPRQLGALRL